MAMPRRTPWYAVDVDVRKDERIADLPSDAARWGYVGAVLAEARLQTQRGVFGSRATLLEAIGRFGRFVPVYLAGGLLEEAPALCGPCLAAFGTLRPGAIVVHNWARKQNDPTHTERDARYRSEHQADGEHDANTTPNTTASRRRTRRENAPSSHARAETHDRDTRDSPLGTDQGVSPSARPDLVALVELHHWRRVTKAQREILDELAEFERLRSSDIGSGYAVVAAWIRETPDGEDPLQYAIACGKGRRAERQLAAGEAEQRWRRQKTDDRATAPERLGAILQRTNGAGTDSPADLEAEPPEVSFDAPAASEEASSA